MTTNLSKLVQISSGSWINPADVKRIYTCKSYREGEPDHTYVVCTGTDSGISLFGEAPRDHVICCDWPIERVTAALGLTSADDLEAHMSDQPPA